MQTWWLSFADPDKPEGERFLGVVVVDVTKDDARLAMTRLLTGPFRDTFSDGAEWISAATAKALRHGCNPGGAVSATCLSVEGMDRTKLADIPRNHLMSAAELRQRGLA